MKAFMLLIGIMVVGCVLFVISVARMPAINLAAIAPPRTTDAARIAAACNALHAPDVRLTQACTAQTALTKDTLLSYCRTHLALEATDDAFHNCYRRVVQHIHAWPVDTQGQWQWQWPVTWQASP